MKKYIKLPKTVGKLCSNKKANRSKINCNYFEELPPGLACGHSLKRVGCRSLQGDDPASEEPPPTDRPGNSPYLLA